MISLVLGAVLAQYSVKFSVLELPKPEAKVVSIHAYLWRDKNYVKEEQAWRLICSVIGTNSLTYNASEVGFFGGSAGIRPRVVSSPDFLRVEVVSSPEKWKESLALAASLVAQPNWRSNQWEEKEKVLAGTVLDSWSESLWPMPDFKEKLLEDEAANAHSRILDRMGLRVIVEGSVGIGEARQELEKVARLWSVPEYRVLSRFSEETKLPMTQNLAVTTYEMSGKPIRIGEKGSAAQFLAAVALGVGKGSTLWETIREREGLAYRTEAVFWPTRGGFVPRLLMLRRAEAGELQYSANMISGLEKAIESYDMIGLVRAKVMAEQILLHPNAFASVYVDSENTLFGLPDDDLRWRGLLNGMGLPSVPLTRWVEMLNEVGEEEFQAAAKDMVDTASFRVTQGVPGL
ncbi:MAG: hypothetical protein ACKVQS_07600 [Fimbriimonadaceae bacterium]